MDPILRFQETFARAQAAARHDPTAVALATADANGSPSVRMVLLKHADAQGFVFYTNRTSRKGSDLTLNPRAALCFYWPDLNESVRVEGAVELVSDADSDAYFAGRPRESQLGAWASRQSRPLERYELLAERFEELGKDYEGKPIPRPKWWDGYRIVPDRIEFWRQGEHRLLHRVVYVRWEGGEGWVTEILNP